MTRRFAKSHRHGRVHGFTLVEAVVVVAIALVAMSLAVPVVRNTLQVYAQRSKISSVTGAIQAARYQAIFQGCQYQVAFSSATSTYSIASKAPAAGAGATACSGAFSAPGPAQPLMGSGATLGADITLTFFPNGSVTQALPVGGGPINITVSYAPQVQETIQVSNYGKVLVTP